ncbi:MAG: hypothetical protein KDA91_25100, partial [Planctomycetaceae bacterium]|nr:hypothetical protein [Planctomycetaceae bacterium]
MDCNIYAAPLYFPSEFLQADWYETVLVCRIDEFSLPRMRERFQQMLNETQHDVIADAFHFSPSYYCRVCYEGWPNERKLHLVAASSG